MLESHCCHGNRIEGCSVAQSTANLVKKLINLTNGTFLVAMVTGICIFSYRGPSMRQVIAIAFRKCNINPMSGKYIQLLQFHFWYTNHVADISLCLNSSGPVRVKEGPFNCPLTAHCKVGIRLGWQWMEWTISDNYCGDLLIYKVQNKDECFRWHGPRI